MWEAERLVPQEEGVRDWNDALDYLTGAPPEETASVAKERLVNLIISARGSSPEKITKEREV